MTRIRRGFVTVGGRQVCYRTAGSGPPVVLLHQSPISSRSLALQTRTFATRFTTIAIDIPGLGQSDPMPIEAPTVDDFAIGLAETLDCLGVQRTALYGSHTGASICVEFARRFPERTVQVLIDGYPIYTPGEQARRMATYFGWVEPRWDGGHLLWAWSRFREQYLFYPWNAPGRGTRADCDVPTSEFLHDGTVDLLTAGKDYVRPYQAAYTYDAARRIRAVSVPTRFLVYRDDLLAKAHALLEGLPECCEIVPMPDERVAGVEKELELLSSAPGQGAPVTLPETTPVASGFTRRYVETEAGQLHIREGGRGGGKPLLVLPPMPGSSTGLLDRLGLLGLDRHVVALDLPSCGDSDGFSAGAESIEQVADRVAEAATKLGLAEYDVYGVNGAALVALELGRRNRELKVVAEGVPYLPDSGAELSDPYAPMIELQDDGTHWLKLWFAVRNEQLFWPWYRQTEAAIRPIEPMITPLGLHEKVLSYMKQHESYRVNYQMVFGQEEARTRAAVSENVRLFSAEHDVFHDATLALAKATGAKSSVLTSSALETVTEIVAALNE